MAEQYYSEYEAYLQKLSRENVTKGVLYEPRAFFDYQQMLDTPQQTPGAPEVFRNGTEWPVVITHLTANLAQLNPQNVPSDSREAQNVGMYLKFHDHYYMSPPQQLQDSSGAFSQVLSPLPTWQNTRSAPGEVTAASAANWRFARPFILSTRDTLRVEVLARSPNSFENPIYTVSVSFTGIGIVSRQPYFLSATKNNLSGAAVQTMDTERYTNDGAEPILITDMAVSVAGDTLNEVDLRRIYIGVRQLGNGTNAAWFQSRLTSITTQPIPNDMICASNLGVLSGARSIVHEFPVPIIWEPGEGVDAVYAALATGLTQRIVQVALLGYVAVQ